MSGTRAVLRLQPVTIFGQFLILGRITRGQRELLIECFLSLEGNQLSPLVMRLVSMRNSQVHPQLRRRAHTTQCQSQCNLFFLLIRRLTPALRSLERLITARSLTRPRMCQLRPSGAMLQSGLDNFICHLNLSRAHRMHRASKHGRLRSDSPRLQMRLRCCLMIRMARPVTMRITPLLLDPTTTNMCPQNTIKIQNPNLKMPWN